jgi:hypothetical protein
MLRWVSSCRFVVNLLLKMWTVGNGTGTCRFGSLTHWQWINDQRQDVPEAFCACVADCKPDYSIRQEVVKERGVLLP